MPTNDFKPFATAGGANVSTQAEYLALAALSTGWQSGKASSKEINKAVRQATFIAAALAQFVSDKGAVDVLDDGNLAGFGTKLIGALNKTSQPLDATLTALAALVGAANKLPYFNGADTAALTDLTQVGRDIIGKSDIAAVLTYLGAVDANGGDYNKFFNFKQVGTLGVDRNQNYLVSADATVTGGLVAWLQNQWHDNTVKWGAVRGGGADLQCAGIEINGSLLFKFFTNGTINANGKDLATQEYVRSSITTLINSSPAALDTLKELADALGNDASFATTMTNALAGKQPLDNTLTNLSGKNVAQLITYLGLGTAALRTVGAGANQIPDMNSFQSGANGLGTWIRHPSGILIQFGLYPTSGPSGGISFPTPFSEAPSYTLTPTAVTGIMAVSAGASTTTINEVRTFNASWEMQTNGVSWIAIGR